MGEYGALGAFWFAAADVFASFQEKGMDFLFRRAAEDQEGSCIKSGFAVSLKNRHNSFRLQAGGKEGERL